MTDLDAIAYRISELHSTLRIRPTVETAQRIGELLSEVKSQLPHGKWQDWLRSRCPHISTRTARTYLQIFSNPGKWPTTATMTIDRMLTMIRQGKTQQRRDEREETRKAIAAYKGKLPNQIKLHHANCKTFKWPHGIDAIVADPDWSDKEVYEWIAEFAANHLRPGGLAFVQCGTASLAHVMATLGEKLDYVWLLIFIYREQHHGRPVGGFLSPYRPVLVYSNGKMPPRKREVMSVVEVPTYSKKNHDWEQPLEPWREWIAKLTLPGELVADPFAGSSTIGVICKELARRYIGTEVDEAAFKVARGRLAGK
jgi:hypothetical protein